nr:hypothetical protein [Tanacetum cinerariifolium]
MFPVTRSTRSTMSRAAHTTTNTPTTGTTRAAATANISGHLHHPAAAAQPIATPHPHCLIFHNHHSNSDGFSSRCRRRGGLWVADWPPPPRGCPPPNHHRGGGWTKVQPPQLHHVVSGYDGATPSEA